MPNILKETARGIDIILLDDELFSNREIFFTDSVNITSATLLLKQLMYLDRADAGKEITLYINSLGGDVISGLAVYDFIKLMKSPVRTVCTGTAASMGAILFLAGEKRVMLPHTRLLIHDPSYGSNDVYQIKRSIFTLKISGLKFCPQTYNKFRFSVPFHRQ